VLFKNEIQGVKKTDKNVITNLIKQSPNTHIPPFNSSVGVSIYNFGKLTFDSLGIAQRVVNLKNEKKEFLSLSDSVVLDNRQIKRINKINNQITALEKKLEFGNFFMRTGNPKVIYDSTETMASARSIKFYLLNQGYFDSDVDYKVMKKNKRAYVTYQITENSPYLITNFYTTAEDSTLQSILQSSNLYKKYEKPIRYEQGLISRTRQEVEDYLKDRGYYTFSKSYVNYNVYKDTLEKKLSIEQRISQPQVADNHQSYSIDSLYFNIDSPSEKLFNEEVKSIFRDIHFTLYKDRYSEKIISSRIFMNHGDQFNRTNVIETQRQLANLDIFRFVNISFDTLGNQITPRIFTQPNQKYQITNQLGASITEQVPGPFVSHSLRNRNLFGGAEIFEFNFRAGLEGVVSATGEGGVFRSRELSTSASILFPQFLLPTTINTLEKFGRFNPRTRVLVGYNYVNRPEYNRESVNGIFAYNWNTRNMKQQFTVNMLDMNFIRSNLNNDFRDILQDLQNQGNNLINSFLPSYVSSISGQVIINFNQYGINNKNSASLWRLYVESGGTSLNFVSKEFIERRSLAYFQFLKFQSDFRRYIPLANRSTFAYRINFGLAKPYGVSNGVLPYEKYFFAGGSTGIRAWQPRRLGPGSYTPLKREDGTFDYRFEQPGDILLEGMFELRKKLYSYFDGAVFIDVGNTWTFLDDPTRPGAQFKFDKFYKDLAVGTGVGLRMDFDFLVLRLDMGVKAIDPARPTGERIIIGKFFKNFLGEPGQTVFNIGIGYPF
jgi:outer membrane protein insertion porin family